MITLSKFRCDPDFPTGVTYTVTMTDGTFSTEITHFVTDAYTDSRPLQEELVRLYKIARVKAASDALKQKRFDAAKAVLKDVAKAVEE